jgi:glucose/arabinose dehydrogenase
MIIADVGETSFEEIDLVPSGTAAGANYGWPCREGLHAGPEACTASAPVDPALEQDHSGAGFCAIVGGYVVRDRRLPSLLHRYVYGDFCTGKIRSLIPDPAGAHRDKSTGVRVRDLSSFGVGADGALYAASLDGPVYRFVRRR